jgi:Domain of unknown function (DUF4276)
VVIVSGEIDRRSVPHLCRHFAQHADLFEVRKPPGNAALTPEQATKLIKAAWCELLYGRGDPPDKFVVLVDSDARDASEAARPFEEAMIHLADVAATRIVAVAIRHLKSWFFGHPEKLRELLGRDLGSVDSSRPDEIDNPKLHLANLLISRSRVYTAPVAAQIAAQLDPLIIEGRSPSFAGFIGKLQNGAATPT